MKKFKKSIPGGSYNYCVTEDRTIYSWGCGDLYVLGTRKEETEYEPHEVNTQQLHNLKVIEFGLGSQHVVFLAASDTAAERPKLDEDVVKKVEEEKATKRGAAARSKSKPNKKDEKEEMKENQTDDKAKSGKKEAGPKQTPTEKEGKTEGRASRSKDKSPAKTSVSKGKNDKQDEKEEAKSGNKRAVNGRKRGAPNTNEELEKEVAGGSNAKKNKVTKKSTTSKR